MPLHTKREHPKTVSYGHVHVQDMVCHVNVGALIHRPVPVHAERQRGALSSIATPRAELRVRASCRLVCVERIAKPRAVIGMPNASPKRKGWSTLPVARVPGSEMVPSPLNTYAACPWRCTDMGESRCTPGPAPPFRSFAAFFEMCPTRDTRP